jgi:DNA-binding transcriptional ArsR family regulator
MNVESHCDAAAPEVAASIGDPARARMLYCLLAGQARTSTELAMVAEVSPSTASVHLARLRKQRLVKVLAQGRHRYYSLNGAPVATLLETLLVVAEGSRVPFVPTTPGPLRVARTCYDHLAGALAVSLHERFSVLGWLSAGTEGDGAYDLTTSGAKGLTALGIDVGALRKLRRRFAYACTDWSERRPHIGGAVGAALLTVALQHRWVVREVDSRVLKITSVGARELRAHFGLEISAYREIQRQSAYRPPDRLPSQSIAYRLPSVLPK